MAAGDKNTYVGQFFEHVGHNILGGILSRDDDGDVCLWETSTSVEVKSSGFQSSYGFRLSVEQIERYEKIVGFPFNRVWYMLFAYRNRSPKDSEKGKRTSELSAHVTPPDIHQYLANSILWGFLVDISIISRWKEKLPHSTKSIIGHRGMETVNLKCRQVRNFMNGGLDSSLKDLDLNPEDFIRLSGLVRTTIQPDLFSEYKIKIPLVVIVPSLEARFVRKMLKTRGFNLKTKPEPPLLAQI